MFVFLPGSSRNHKLISDSILSDYDTRHCFSGSPGKEYWMINISGGLSSSIMATREDPIIVRHTRTICLITGRRSARVLQARAYVFTSQLFQRTSLHGWRERSDWDRQSASMVKRERIFYVRPAGQPFTHMVFLKRDARQHGASIQSCDGHVAVSQFSVYAMNRSPKPDEGLGGSLVRDLTSSDHRGERLWPKYQQSKQHSSCMC